VDECGVAGEQDPAFTNRSAIRWCSGGRAGPTTMATSRPSSSATTCSPTRRSGGLATGSRRRSGRTPTTTVTRGRRRTTAGRWWKPQTGSTFVGYENPLGVTTAEQCVRSFLASDRADWYRHVNVTAHDHGGHFIPWELPTEWVDECAGPSADSADRRRLRLVRLLSVVMVGTESADSWPSTSFPTKRGDAIRDRAHGDAIAHAVTDVFGTTDANESVEPACQVRRLDPAMGPGVTDAPASSSDSTRAASR
jgi:hypothetical protein